MTAAATSAARARSAPPLPPPYQYVVKPFRISPDVGALSGTKTPFFREPFLLATDIGLVTGFMEVPPSNASERYLWACNAPTGERWHCVQVPRGGRNFIDAADPWLADTRGDPCPRVGSGITMTSTRRNGGTGDTGRVVVYHSRDLGTTWTDPQPIPEPSTRNVNPDGTKIFFSGRTYVGYREFIVGPGQFMNRLGTDAHPCAWAPATELPTGDDHPRFAATAERGGVAVRSADTSVLAGGIVLRFNKYSPTGSVELPGTPMGLTGTTLVPAFCTSSGTCRTGADVGQTLLYDPLAHRYHHVFSDRPTPDKGTPGDVVVRYNQSNDGGLTWSAPEQIAGTGTPYSASGASAVEPTLAFDPVLGKVVLAYYEKTTRDSLRVELRIRTLTGSGWSRPVTVDSTSYIAYGSTNDTIPIPKPINGEPEMRFGDYLGLAACGGVIHLVHHPLDATGKGLIAYTAVRYDTAARADRPGLRRACPALPGAATSPGASGSPGGAARPSHQPSTAPAGAEAAIPGTNAGTSAWRATTGTAGRLAAVGGVLLAAAGAVHRRRRRWLHVAAYRLTCTNSRSG